MGTCVTDSSRATGSKPNIQPISKRPAGRWTPPAAPTTTRSILTRRSETGRIYRGHFNVKNKGLIENLADDAIVETPGFVDRFGLNMAAGLRLPLACAATCEASINVQRMSVEAAVTGDLELLKLAVLHDPLTGAVCTPDEIWRMVDEMVVAQAKWLPQYADAIEGARRRLASAPARNAERSGAATRPVRSANELRAARAKKRNSNAAEDAASVEVG